MDNANVHFLFKDFDWRDVVFYGSLAATLIWALAKTFGYI